MLNPSKRKTLKQQCRACEMGGTGILDILKSAGKFLVDNLGPIAKEVGPVVLKELVVPLLKNKVGLGLSLAGGRKGSGLRLSGQRGPRRKSSGCAITKATKRGKGLRLSGSGAKSGKGLRLAGQGPKKANPWLAHVKKVKTKNPNMAFKDVLKKASKTWKK